MMPFVSRENAVRALLLVAPAPISMSTFRERMGCGVWRAAFFLTALEQWDLVSQQSRKNETTWRLTEDGRKLLIAFGKLPGDLAAVAFR